MWSGDEQSMESEGYAGFAQPLLSIALQPCHLIYMYVLMYSLARYEKNLNNLNWMEYKT